MNITSPGTYPAGTYVLQNDITVSSGDGLAFTGPAALDLNGFTVSTSQNGNAWDYGVKFLGANSSISNGAVTGFRVGVKFEGDGSSSVDVDYSRNRYFGVWIEADNVTVTGGEISEIDGVTDEGYAIGVQCNGHGCVVDGVLFQELYPQSGFPGGGVNECVGVNFSAQSASGTFINSTILNTLYGQSTIGVFASGGNGHHIENITTINVMKPVQISMYQPYNTVTNIHAGFEYGQTTGISGELFSETLDTVFGNIATATLKVRIKASEMSAVAGTQTRLVLHASGVEPLQVSGIYIGHAATGASASSLTQLKFGGASGTVIPVSGSAATDWSSFVWDGTSDVIVSFYSGTDSAKDLVPAKDSTPHSTFRKLASDAASATATGYTEYPGYLSAVGKIEVQ
jgi:hypothetical protein